MTASDREFAVWFGHRVQGARDAAGLTHEEVARRAQMDPSELAEIERGLRTPDLSGAIRLAGALGVAPAGLVKGAQWQSERGRYSFEEAEKWDR